MAASSVYASSHLLRSIAEANHQLGPAGIRLKLEHVEYNTELPREIKSSIDRRHLAEHTEHDGCLHVFEVESLELSHPRHGDQQVSGMHWRFHGLHQSIRGIEYVVIAQGAPSTTLAHEIGHALGLEHRRNPQNMMCSCQRSRNSHFDIPQLQMMEHRTSRLNRRLQSFVRQKK